MYIQITPFFPSKNTFVGSYIYDHVKELMRQYDGDVKLFKTVSLFSNETDYKFEDINVHIIKKIALPSHIFPFLFSFLNFMLFKHKLKSLHIDVHKIDVLHVHNLDNAIYGSFLKRENRKIKFFIQEHGLGTLGINLGILKGNKYHARYLINSAYKFARSCDLIIGVSNRTIIEINKFDKLKELNKYILYNGVDSEKFYKKNLKKEIGEIHIGCIGNFIDIKNQMMLLKALVVLNKCVNFRASFIGTGPTLDTCKKYVVDNDLSQKVNFITSIEHNALVDFYNSLHLFVLPSHYEALGCVYLEAHACGIPFIGVYGQGIEEYISEEDKRNWLVNKDDYQQLANLIQRSVAKEQILVQSYDIEYLMKNFLLKNVL